MIDNILKDYPFLDSSDRIQVVERVLLERLLEELNIGYSELADPETALRLGKVLAAKLISTGHLFHMPNAVLLSLRLIDTETSGIAKVMTKQFGSQALLRKELFRLNREILKTIISNYPLRGYIIEAKGDLAILNLGSNHGVVMGTKFDVIEEQKPIEFNLLGFSILSCSPKHISYKSGATIAVLDLDNVSPLGNTVPDLGELFANQIIETLKEKEGITIVERERLLLALEELHLGTSSLADEDTCLKLGRIIGARLMVFGSY